VSKPDKYPRYSSIVTGCPVVGYTGPNGVGKTLVAVSDGIEDMRAGRKLVSTVPVSSPWGDSEPLLSLRQLLELRDCTLLVDEVAAVFSSRDGVLPYEVEIFLQSMRHQGVTLRWTAPAWARANILLREVTQVSVPVFRIGRIGKGFWPRPLLVGAAAMDVTGLKLDQTPEKVMFGSRRLWVPQRLPGWGRYDSEANVSRIGWPRQNGRCPDCGGTVRAEACTVERHEHLGIGVEGAADFGKSRARAAAAASRARVPAPVPGKRVMPGPSASAANPAADVVAASLGIPTAGSLMWGDL